LVYHYSEARRSLVWLLFMFSPRPQTLTPRRSFAAAKANRQGSSISG